MFYLFSTVDNGLEFQWDTTVAGSTVEMVSPKLPISTLASGLDFCLELLIRMRDVQLDVLAGFSQYLDEEMYIGSLIPDLEISETFSTIFHKFSFADIMNEYIQFNSTSTEVMLKFRFTVPEPGNPLLQFEHIKLSEQNCNDPSKRRQIECVIGNCSQIVS